jgi:small subunit ribosomal protein S17
MADSELPSEQEALADPEVVADVEAIAPGAEAAIAEELGALPAEADADAAPAASGVVAGGPDEAVAAALGELGADTAGSAPAAAAVPTTAPAATAPAAAPPTIAPAAVDTGPESRPNPRKVRVGLVVSISMDKTAVVAVIERVRHPRYAKTVQRTKRFYAHDPENESRVGDRVRLAETRPISKLKRWRIVEVLDRAR